MKNRMEIYSRFKRADFVRVASKPIERKELMRKLGFTSDSGMAKTIMLMREQGHDIWTIKDGKQSLVWWRSGPEVEDCMTTSIYKILLNGEAYTNQEFAEMFGTTTRAIWQAVVSINKNYGAIIDRRRINHQIMEYQLKCK